MKARQLLGAVLLTAGLTACAAVPPLAETPTPAPTPTPVPAAFSLPYYSNTSLHPITGTNRTNLTLRSLVYEGLFTLNNDFEPENGLCASHSVSEDGLRWTFRLTATRFSDGSRLTAEDVVNSLNTARSSELYAQRLGDLSKVEGEGDTVTITLRRPRGNLPALLDIPILRESEEGQPPLGTGRYAYDLNGEEPKLVRTEDSETLPEEIPLTAIQGADDLIYAFDAKDISLVATDLTGTDTLGFSGGYEVWDCPTTQMVYLGFHTQSGPCADETLRRAVALALDRESVCVALYARHAQSAATPVPPQSGLYDRAAAQSLTYSPPAAAQLLEEGGYTLKDGTLYKGRSLVKLSLLVNTDNSFRVSVAEFLAQSLRELGLTVTVEKLSWTDYQARLAAGRFDLYLGETSLSADFDLTALVGRGGSLNYGGWSSAETQTLLNGYLAADSETRQTAAAALQGHLAQQVPFAPICFKQQSVLTQWGQMTGLTPTRADPFAGTAWQIH